MFLHSEDITKLLSKTWKYITIHASATPPNQNHDVVSIRKMHTNKGWSDIGYHILIRRDGVIELGRPFTRWGAHVKGHNVNNIGICLVGGVDRNNKAVCNYTDEQFDSLKEVLMDLVGILGIKDGNIKGHRDWSPDLNGDGKITPDEYIKMCPCFTVSDFLKEWMG